MTNEAEAGIRLQKVLAQAGVGSRRACEQLIEEGRVSVNGKAVREQGMRVDPNRDAIHVDGTRVPTAEETLVLAVNKPIGMVSTMSDDRGRPCVGDLVFDRPERLFHVGRLDVDTEGLILLTNDGDLDQHLAHPSHGVPKTYVATLLGIVPRDLGRRMKAGLELEDGMARVDEFRLVSSTPGRGDSSRGSQAHRAPSLCRGRTSGRVAGACTHRAHHAWPDAARHRTHVAWARTRIAVLLSRAVTDPLDLPA